MDIQEHARELFPPHLPHKMRRHSINAEEALLHIPKRSGRKALYNRGIPPFVTKF